MNEPKPPAPPRNAPETGAEADPSNLPPYEPPRIVRKRSVARATLATGTGPLMGGLMAQG